jgi:hypothetical protein
LDDALVITETMSKHKSVWIEIMMLEELGLLGVSENPVKDAIVTFISFMLFGSVARKHLAYIYIYISHSFYCGRDSSLIRRSFRCLYSYDRRILVCFGRC